MSYNKTYRQVDGRNGARQSGNMAPSGNNASAAPPRSTLASLLSSQRRSAVQSDRYRVQRARPFADNSHIDRTIGSKRDGAFSHSSQEKGRGSNISHRASYTDSSAGSSSTSDRSSTIPSGSFGMDYRKLESRSIGRSETATASRRVRFSSPSKQSEETPRRKKSRWGDRTGDIPRKKSRWDVRPPSTSLDLRSTAVGVVDTSIQNKAQENSAIANESTSSLSQNNQPIPTKKSKSILRRRERLEWDENDRQQKFITTYSTTTSLDMTTKPTDLPTKPTDLQSSKTSYLAMTDKKSFNELKGSHRNNSVTDTNHAYGGTVQSQRNSREGVSISKIMPSMDPIAEAAQQTAIGPKGTGGKKSPKEENENALNPKKSDIKKLGNVGNSDVVPAGIAENLSCGIEQRHDSSTEPLVVKGKKSAIQKVAREESKIGPQSILANHSMPKQESPVSKEDALKRKQGARISPTIDATNKEKANTSNNAQVAPPPSLSSKPKLQQDEKTPSTTSPKKKRRKYCNPFRVKVGCVVAVRFHKLADGGNTEIVPVMKEENSYRVVESSLESVAMLKQKDGDDSGCNTTDKNGNVDKKEDLELADASDVSTGQDGAANGKENSATKAAIKSNSKDKATNKREPSYYEVWSDPIPGQDDGISLLGSWIRCAFTKSFIAHWQKSNNNEKQSSLGRFIEGNIISILGNNDGSQGGVTVCLLVDRAATKSLPYLNVVSDDLDDATMSSSKQKRRKLEAKIRGENKVVVTVTLASLFDQMNGSKIDPSIVSQWVVRKRVSAKPAGKKPSKIERTRKKQHAQSLFVGDGNDTQSQQETNWRWIASRTACQPMGTDMGKSSALGNNMRDTISGLVGEVVSMDISPKEMKNGNSTLATVTLKRLWTPEQTACGRLPHHGPFELFDSSSDDSSCSHYFQAPIEQLIVIGKCVDRHLNVQEQLNSGCNAGDDSGWKFSATHAYHAGENTYMPLKEDSNLALSKKVCHYCQRSCHESMMKPCQHRNRTEHAWWCLVCLQLMKESPQRDSDVWIGPCCNGKCDCMLCHSPVCEKPFEPNHNNLPNDISQSFSGLMVSLQSQSPIDFKLQSPGQFALRPSFLPITGDMKSKSYSKVRRKEDKKPDSNIGKRKKRGPTANRVKSRKKLKVGSSADTEEEEEDDVFQPECRRTVSFDQLKKRYWGSSKLKVGLDETKQPFFREKARPRIIKIGKTEEKTTLSGRAARANQRRMFKSLAALGDASKKVDRLAGRDREQQLRFDKSQIHGWGVFAEESINAGDMIIEYRGEVIGNAVADKRELEYQVAKLDDYMFRIDAYTVCDATILGNVARYINSSCNPNCHTQIITAGENKRIVIYAKRDIQIGEELCYDYKFSLEYDPSKRIICCCGSSDCRGFMNWDKRYV